MILQNYFQLSEVHLYVQHFILKRFPFFPSFCFFLFGCRDFINIYKKVNQANAYLKMLLIPQSRYLELGQSSSALKQAMKTFKRTFLISFLSFIIKDIKKDCELGNFKLPYRRYLNPGVLFFKMDFWVVFNSNFAIIFLSSI